MHEQNLDSPFHTAKGGSCFLQGGAACKAAAGELDVPEWQELAAGGLYLTGHLRCCAAPSASFGSRGLSHGCPRK
jgi:hypothetical protein